MTRILRTSALALFLLTALVTGAQAADDPSIRGELRAGIHASMQDFVAHQTVDGVFRHYDPVEGKLLHLEQANLHAGIVKKGDFYISCADFVDQDGRKLDLDFLVLDAGGEMRTVQALVHKIEGDKRPYDVETD